MCVLHEMLKVYRPGRKLRDRQGVDAEAQWTSGRPTPKPATAVLLTGYQR